MGNQMTTTFKTIKIRVISTLVFLITAPLMWLLGPAGIDFGWPENVQWVMSILLLVFVLVSLLFAVLAFKYKE